MRELKSLALDVRVLDADGNEVKIKDSSAEETDKIKRVAPTFGEDGTASNTVASDVDAFIEDDDESKDEEYYGNEEFPEDFDGDFAEDAADSDFDD